MKKFISCMLALVMVLGIMSVGVMAADPIYLDDFDDYADANAAKVNWSTVNALDDDGKGGYAIRVNVAQNNTTGSTYYKGAIPENVYTVSFRVKTDVVTAATKITVFTNGISRFETTNVTTEWSTVSCVVPMMDSWWNTEVNANAKQQQGLKIQGDGVSGSVQQYIIDDVVLTPYAGNILADENGDFEKYSATEVVGFAKQGSNASFSATPTSKGQFGYDTGADGTGYSLKIVGSGATDGVKAEVAMATHQTVKVNFKLKSTVAVEESATNGNVKIYLAGGSAYASVTNTGVWEDKEVIVTPPATNSIGKNGALFYIQTPSKVKDTDAIWIDDVVMTVVANEVAAPQPPVVEPTEYAVTISGDAGAKVSVAAATSEGEAVDFTVAPKFGYYIQSITVGGTAIDVLDAYKGGTYTTGAIAADTAIVVTTASLADNTDANVSTEVATLPAVFAESTTAVTFGKVLDRTNAESWGVELTKDGVGVTPYHGGSYLYQANATSASGQYAIEFIGLEAGTYQIRSYVLVNGTPEFGAPATFVVAE